MAAAESGAEARGNGCLAELGRRVARPREPGHGRQLLAMLGYGGGNSSARLGRPKKEREGRAIGPRGRKGLMQL